MDWVEVFTVLALSHLVGDFLVQTEWQARNKAGGLGSDPQARRALFSHVLTYTLCFVPALIWIAGEIGAGVVWAAALIAVPHLLQDDGRLLGIYMRAVKHSDATPGDLVHVAVDQSIHLVVLYAIAVLVG